MTEKEAMKQFCEENYRTVAQIENAVKQQIEDIKDYAKQDYNHTAAFYNKFIQLCEQFLNDVKSLVLFKDLEECWAYDFEVDDRGVELRLQHFVLRGFIEDTGKAIFECDQEYVLHRREAIYIPIEEYAATYNVPVRTVAQWIRRGKIRDAKKIGNVWLISELIDIPEKGFTNAMYRWKGERTGIPSEYSFIRDAGLIMVQRSSSDKGMFEVVITNKELKDVERKEMNRNEREKFELFLISHPNIAYLPLDDVMSTVISDIEEEKIIAGKAFVEKIIKKEVNSQ